MSDHTFSEVHSDCAREREIEESKVDGSRQEIAERLQKNLIASESWRKDCEQRAIALEKDLKMKDEWLTEWRRVAESLQRKSNELENCIRQLKDATDKFMECVQRYDSGDPATPFVEVRLSLAELVQAIDEL